MNTVTQIKTVGVNGPNGPSHAIMMAVNINDPKMAEAFVSEVAEQFKLHRMISPPETNMLLITLVGDLAAHRFASQWHEIEQSDPILHHFMSLMVVADVIQGTKEGWQVSNASLKASECSES